MTHGEKTTLSPSQQQLQNSLNQKTNPLHSQNTGWEYYDTTHPHKKKKPRDAQLSPRRIPNRYLQWIENIYK
jgi:hypothetical protein